MVTTNLKNKTMTHNGHTIHLQPRAGRALAILRETEKLVLNDKIDLEPEQFYFMDERHLDWVRRVLNGLPKQKLQEGTVVADVSGVIFANIEDGCLFVIADAQLPWWDQSFLPVWALAADHNLKPFTAKIWQDSTTVSGESISLWFNPANVSEETPTA